MAIAGQFADADVVALEGQIVCSAAGVDCPEHRMYYQNQQEIKSATSPEGLNWQDEPGTRIDKNETDFNLESVVAPTVTRLDNGDYLMVYRGTENKPYETSEKLPNQNTQVFFYATSPDGINFTKKGLAIDSRNETLYGLVDRPEWVKWDSQFRLYFWSYSGVYYSTFENDKFSEPKFAYSNNIDTKMKFAPNPPADPTIAKIGNQWFMYYGQHGKGIYYATLKE